MIQETGSYSYPFLFTSPVEGMRKAMKQASDAAQKVAEGDISPDNLVAGMEAKIMMKANVATLKTADSMLGTLLDRKA